MHRKLSLLVGSSLPFLPVLALATATRPAVQDDVTRRLERCAEVFVAEEDPAALVAIVDVGGRTLMQRGWGRRGGRAPGADTSFAAGALTEPLVVAGVMRLVEGGDVALDTPLSKLLAEFADDPRPITVGHLLAHASGLPRLEECPALRRGEVPDTAALLAWLRAAPSYAEPGTCLSYSDADTLLAGLVLERLAERSVRAFVERDVVAALQLEGTRYATAGDTGVPYAGGQLVAGRLERSGAAPGPFGARALETSAADLVRVQRALVDGTLVEDASWQRMSESGLYPDGTPTNHGLGLALTPLDDHACARWGGRALGSGFVVAWYPALELTVAVIAEGDVPLDTLERRLARTLLELPGPELGDLELTPEQRAVYLGDYYLGCTRLTIAEGADGRLRALSADGPERVLLAQGAHRFVVQGDPEVRYAFEVDGALATAFELEEHGARFRAVRID